MSLLWVALWVASLGRQQRRWGRQLPAGAPGCLRLNTVQPQAWAVPRQLHHVLHLPHNCWLPLHAATLAPMRPSCRCPPPSPSPPSRVRGLGVHEGMDAGAGLRGHRRQGRGWRAFGSGARCVHARVAGSPLQGSLTLPVPRPTDCAQAGWWACRGARLRRGARSACVTA